MAEYAWLVCWQCKVTLALGKAVAADEESERIVCYATAEGVGPEQVDTTKALWRMMADHVGHPMEVVREYSRRFEDIGELDENGDDVYDDIDIEAYAEGYGG